MVGASIGANNVPLAKKIAKFTFILSFSFCLVISVLLLVFRTQAANFFTTDEEVRSIMYSMIPINALVYLPDAAQGLLSGTVRGLGIQRKVAGFVILAYYTVGFPIGLVLAFRYDMKIRGLWLGTFFSCSLQFFFFLRAIRNEDW